MFSKVRVPTIWDERYCLEAAPLTSTTKQAKVVRVALDAGLFDVHRDVDFDPVATWAHIATIHAPEYVNAIRTGRPASLAESQGFRWSPAFADSVARLWSGHQAAARLAFRKGLALHPVSGAHHAGRDHGSGFCTFNYLVGAGEALLLDGTATRVGVIDLDAHMGNGTYALVQRNPCFGIFDISASCWIQPLDERRLFVQAATQVGQYFQLVGRLPRWLDTYRPDFVQYQAGVDCYEGDAMGAVRGLDESDLEARDRYVVREVTSRILVNLAGGYLEDVTEGLHVGTIRVMAAELGRLEARDACFGDLDP